MLPPLAVQVTDVLLAPVTVAANCCAPPGWTFTEAGATLTVTPNVSWMVSVRTLEPVPIVASTLAVAGPLGSVAGAV
jgi:hypothetical protein